MPEKTIDLLRATYREQMASMHARSEECETSKAQFHEVQGSAVHDKLALPWVLIGRRGGFR
jgi:hypothetical protein